MNHTGLEARDFITIGIFTALHFTVVALVSCIGFIPALMVVMPSLCAVCGAPPFMLFLTRAGKFGMVTIMGVLLGLTSLLLARPLPSLAIGAGAGLLADLCLKSRAGRGRAVVCCGVFSLWIMAMALPLFFGYQDAYLARMRGFGESYAAEVQAVLSPPWMFWFMTASVLIGGLVGGLIGRAVLKKHFVKAGLA